MYCPPTTHSVLLKNPTEEISRAWWCSELLPLGVVHWLRKATIGADRVDVGAYLVFHPVQTGTNGVAATVLALLYGIKHKVRGMRLRVWV